MVAHLPSSRKSRVPTVPSLSPSHRRKCSATTGASPVARPPAASRLRSAEAAFSFEKGEGLDDKFVELVDVPFCKCGVVADRRQEGLADRWIQQVEPCIAAIV